VSGSAANGNLSQPGGFPWLQTFRKPDSGKSRRISGAFSGEAGQYAFIARGSACSVARCSLQAALRQAVLEDRSGFSTTFRDASLQTIGYVMRCDPPDDLVIACLLCRRGVWTGWFLGFFIERSFDTGGSALSVIPIHVEDAEAAMREHAIDDMQVFPRKGAPEQFVDVLNAALAANLEVPSGK